MNNFHIYEEVGRGKYSVVYKVISPLHLLINFLNATILKILLGKKEEDDRLCCSEVSGQKSSQEGFKRGTFSFSS